MNEQNESENELQQAQLKRLAKEINRPLGKVSKTVELLDAGNTIPFIARYRKEVTR